MTSAPRIALIEYGLGNIESVANALRRLECTPQLVGDGDALLACRPSHVVLPGVGAMGAALASLRSRGLDTALQRLVMDDTTPFLGICVGMQVMASRCEEFGSHRGLGWIDGQVTHLAGQGVRRPLPHIGWNTVNARRREHPAAAALDGRDAYFLHTYAMQCDGDDVLATTSYDSDFACMVGHGHILGVQFHPEKSSAVGSALFSSFLGL